MPDSAATHTLVVQAAAAASMVSHAGAIAARESASTFRRTLRRALIRDLEPDLVLTEKVAVLIAAGYRRSEITRMVGCTPTQLRACIDRLKRVAPDLEPVD